MSTAGLKLAGALSLAWSSILAHKLRSFLTLLGIMIGVASVILVGSAIDGMGIYAEQSVSKAFGSESYMIAQVAQTGNMTRSQVFAKRKYNRQLKLADERYLQSLNGENTLYSPYRNSFADTKREGLVEENTSIIGVAANMAEIRDIDIAEGRFFSQVEEQNSSYVAVIGDDLKNDLFPGIGSPLGKQFRIQDLDFTVVGVLTKLGSAFGQSQDNVAYLPVTTYKQLFGPETSIAIFGRARTATGIPLLASLDFTRVALRTRFHQKPGEIDRFDFLTPDAIRGFINNILSMVAVVVMPVTLISLVVGGIVIMNIMLVSVTERTREIGIRKSLGARRTDIMRQILLEALIMAFAGGAAGVALGGLLTALLTNVFAVTLRVPPFYVALSVLVSGAVGMISGWYPASKAAKLDPIVALRAE
jgi:putative ABC transport system permease protein